MSPKGSKEECLEVAEARHLQTGCLSRHQSKCQSTEAVLVSKFKKNVTATNGRLLDMKEGVDVKENGLVYDYIMPCKNQMSIKVK